MTEQIERAIAEPRQLGEIRFWPRSFADRLTSPLPSLGELLRGTRRGGRRPADAGPFDPPPPAVDRSDLPRVALDQSSLTWVGHASWVIRTGGLTLLTDPVWSEKVLGTSARVTPAGRSTGASFPLSTPW